jgi:diguanylate cyclase (GGDEF)-like protein
MVIRSTAAAGQATRNGHAILGKPRADSKSADPPSVNEVADKGDLAAPPTFDSLTGLCNCQAILSELDELISSASLHKEDLSLSMLDIDDFKVLNDHYGHFTGDEVLAKIAASIRRNIRDTDVVGRHGGDEFLILFPKTNLSSSWAAAERLRCMIEEAPIRDSMGNVLSMTVSQGLAGWERNEDAASLISRANDALLKAKEKGRNRVQILLGPSLRGKI